MPLLDAFLAFAITMLAIASLTTTSVAFLDARRGHRRRQLAAMVREFFSDRAWPAAARALETRERVNSEGCRALHQALGKRVAAENGGLTRAAAADALLEELDARGSDAHSTEELLEWITSSPLGLELEDLGDEDSKRLLEALGRAWERLGKSYTERYRSRARALNTAGAAVLALIFNIDSFHVLGTYLSDPEIRADVIEARLDSLEETENEEPPTVDRLEQGLADLQNSGFPIGWSLFPNCPPVSTDGRCVRYWQRSLSTFSVEALDYDDRQAINPIPHYRVALGMDALPGAPPGDSPKVKPGLRPWDLLIWLLGLATTAFLAGRGAPFWFEAVQKLIKLREDLRSERVEARGDAPEPEKPAAETPA
ncbi:MAG: hypothetical protein AAF725_24555 [Acidobacteriota bacterium]